MESHAVIDVDAVHAVDEELVVGHNCIRTSSTLTVARSILHALHSREKIQWGQMMLQMTAERSLAIVLCMLLQSKFTYCHCSYALLARLCKQLT